MGQVEGAADRLTGFSQSLELLDRGGQCGGLLLQLPDEPGILDRDHRLVGKNSDQIDLLARERLNVITGERDHADRLAIAQQRHAEYSAEAAKALCLSPSVALVRHDIVIVQHAPLHGGSPDHGS